MSLRSLLILAVWSVLSTATFAQQIAPTTVQLPTFSSFTVGTTVAVPDSGWGFAHRPCQVSHGWTAFGPAWGASSVSWQEIDHFSMWSVGAQSIDLAALDSQVLASAAARPVVAPDPFARQLVASRDSSAAFVPGSVAEARRARAAELAAEQGEINELVAQADALIREGKSNVARVYLQMAAGKANGARKGELERRAAALKQVPPR